MTYDRSCPPNSDEFGYISHPQLLRFTLLGGKATPEGAVERDFASSG